MAFDPTFVYGNYVEAGLWTVMAGVVAFKVRTARGVALTVLLLAFGVSDVVETSTGGWYTPWWMLTWKTVCVIGIVVLGGPMAWQARNVQRANRGDMSI